MKYNKKHICGITENKRKRKKRMYSDTTIYLQIIAAISPVVVIILTIVAIVFIIENKIYKKLEAEVLKELGCRK